MSDRDLPKMLEKYGGALDLRRIALVADDLHGLPSFGADTKTGDSRHKWYVANYGDRCWELDALSPVILRERVRSSIIDLIEPNAWNAAIKTETEAAEIESMRESVADRIGKLRKGDALSIVGELSPTTWSDRDGAA